MVVIAFEAAYNEESGVSDWSLTELGVVLDVVSELTLFFIAFLLFVGKMIGIDSLDIAVVIPLLEIFLIVIDDVLIVGCDRNEEGEKDNSTGVVVNHDIYDNFRLL